ncbi:MAG: P-loop NTPase fold protein [bacterium]
MTLVEQIRHLVYRASDSGLRFILAVDRDIVTRAVAQKYEGIDDFDANRYLEKIFPLSVRVPSPGAAMPHVVDYFVDSIREADGRQNFTPEIREHLRRVFADELFANPRLLKRCLNRYLLYREWGGARLAEDDALLAIKWLAATDRWPDLRRVFRRFKRDYWERIARATLLDRTDMPGPEAEKLRKSTGLLTWLQNERIIESQTDGPRLGSAYERLKGIDTAFMERGQ